MGSLPAHHRPAPPHSLLMGRQKPELSLLERFLPLPSYLCQFQEHKDVPVDVHHHLSCFHQPGHGVLLCNTHSQESAELPQ